MNIGSIQEVADVARVSKQAAWNWTKRYEDFPKPIAILAMGPIFDLDKVRIWVEARK